MSQTTSMLTPRVRDEDLAHHRPAMVEMLEQLVAEETPAENKPVIDRLMVSLEQRFTASGARTAISPRPTSGNVLRAEWGPQHGEPVLLLAHVDTVWPVGEVARRPFRIEGDRAYGPGVLDMKAGVVIAHFAMQALADIGHVLQQPVVAIVNADEEIGSAASREVIVEEARKSHAVLVLEPAMPDGALKTSRKGWGLLRLAINGRAAHAGANPEQGISAVDELARQVLYLHALTNFERGTTVNVGVVRAGTRPNVIAAEAEAEIDIRTTSEAEAQRIALEVGRMRPVVPGASIEVTELGSRPPMERLPGNVHLYARARALAQKMGFDLGEASSGAASDGNFATALGIPTLDGLGAVGAGPHAVEEMVEVPSLSQRAALLASLIVSLDRREDGPSA